MPFLLYREYTRRLSPAAHDGAADTNAEIPMVSAMMEKIPAATINIRRVTCDAIFRASNNMSWM